MTATRRATRWIALSLALAVLAACSADRSSSPTADGQGQVEQIEIADRSQVEPIEGQLLDGGTFDSRDLAGQVIVYNVWGSWCAPCRDEAPILRRVWEEYRADEVAFVGINVRDNDAAARAFERSYGIDYPSITTDTSRTALLAFGAALPPSAVPSTLVVDTEGRLAARVIGPVSYGTLFALVEEAQAEATG